MSARGGRPVPTVSQGNAGPPRVFLRPHGGPGLACPALGGSGHAAEPRRRALLGALAVGPWLPASLSATPARKGQVVQWPEVTLLDGSRWGPAQAQGKTVVVVFWATTCPFCLRHNAHIEKLRRAAEGRPLEILTVARDPQPAAVRAYLARHGYGFPVTLEHAAMAAALSARTLIPLTLVVDRRGRLQHEIPGEMFEDDVMEWLRGT